jgi:DNA-binding NarL/FixJ family response regulator
LEIIILSVDASDAEAAKAAGAGFVYKGASPDELIAILKPLLDKKKQA